MGEVKAPIISEVPGQVNVLPSQQNECIYVCKGKNAEEFSKEIKDKVDGKLDGNEFKFTASEDEETFEKYKKIADKHECKLTLEKKIIIRTFEEFSNKKD